MTNMFTLKKYWFLCSVVIGLLFLQISAKAQPNNWALSTYASIDQTGGTGNYGPQIYIDDIVDPYPGQNNFGYVTTGGQITFWWNFPQGVVDSLKKIVFYSGSRPATSFDLKRFDPTTGTWTLLYSYNDINHVQADSFFFPAIKLTTVNPGATRDSLRLDNIQGPAANPTFREIRLYGPPSCAGIPSATINARLYGGETAVAGTSPLSSTINACFGYTVYFGAESNFFTSGHGYQWQINNSGTWTNIPGATTWRYEYKALKDAQIRVVDTCQISGQYATSNSIQVTVTNPTAQYQSIPYFMGFDNTWNTSSCLQNPPYTQDLPDATGWSNEFPFGFNSWRVNSPVTTTTSGWADVNNAYSTSGNAYPYNAPFPTGSRSSARAHTSSSSFIPGTVANLDMYLDCSSPSGNKALYFYYINQGVINTDSLRVLMSTDEGATWTRLGGYQAAMAFTKTTLPVQSNAAKTIIRFQATKMGNDNSDIGIDSVYVVGPCSGTPSAGTITPTGTISACAGSSFNITTLGATMAGNLVYTWEQAKYVNGTWTPFAAVTGGTNNNSLFFTSPPLYDTIRYRLKLQCGATGTPVYSDELTINVAERYYAPLPYAQDFETWTTKCATNDVPVSTVASGPINWANNPATGNNSWRRDDQGTISIWNLMNTAGAYPPLSGHSARFHSAGSFPSYLGNLDLLFDGSSSPGNKELRFFQINTNGDDSLKLMYSTDGGGNFTSLGNFPPNASGWYQTIRQIPCSTATCVVRFQANGHYAGQSDIGIDSLMILPSCSGLPTAGTISNDTPCSGATFTLQLSGYSVSGGITYIWEQSSSPNGPWVPSGSTTTYLTTNITANTYYRVRVKCAASGLEDTTAVRYIQLATFYSCYCTSGANVGSGADIGNVSVKKLPYGIPVFSNGVATPVNNNPLAVKTYSDFRNPLNAIPVYRDSTYSFTVQQINSGSFISPGTTVSIFIDTNHNGTFDSYELITHKNSINTTTPQQTVIDTFLVPGWTPTGLTGMRVVMQQGINQPPAACGPYSAGETEDYLIDIRYHPCLGMPNTGLVTLSDSLACPGYKIMAMDTTHEHELYGLRWVWQYSPDSNAWADIPGSIGRDTVTQTVTGQTYFRIQMVCTQTFDTAYSNAPKVTINPPYACYCASRSAGGPNDSSDIGGFTLHDLSITNTGPHLLNPFATKTHTDYTRTDTLDLWVDSTYFISVYHTQNSKFHKDAKVTVFMDLNNDFQYSRYPIDELIWTGYTTETNFVVSDSITIPPYAMPNVLTGMRVILNNDTGPNPQSDSACGIYTSGETEDYIVRFHVPFSVNVNPLDNVSRLSVYPNPTHGRFNILLEAKKPVSKLSFTVTNLTGQKIMEQQFSNVGNKLLTEVNLGDIARGVYLIEVNADGERQIQKLIVK